MRILYLVRYGIFTLLVTAGIPTVWSAEEPPTGPHRTLQGIVVDKGGAPAVKVPDGTVYQLNENRSLRYGHQPGQSLLLLIITAGETNAESSPSYGQRTMEAYSAPLPIRG